MMELKMAEFKEFREFIDWKIKNPEEYKKFMEHLEEFFVDFIKIAEKVMEG